MSKDTGISWTDHTWNGWEGCTRISPGCRNCYMFAQLQRYGRNPNVVRRTNTWRDLLRWDEEARAAGRVARVFTCSLSDFFHEGADAWRGDAWNLMRECTHLRFQVLTKRILRVAEHLPPDWGEGYFNVWLGTSIEDNEHVWRADVLRKIPARVRFISAEPLLGPLPDLDLRGIHWLIVGGESGPGWRLMDRSWARQLRDRARANGVAFFFKQSAAPRAGTGDLLDGREWKEFPDEADAAATLWREKQWREEEERRRQQDERSQRLYEEERRDRLEEERRERQRQEEQRRQEEERQRQEAEASNRALATSSRRNSPSKGRRQEAEASDRALTEAERHLLDTTRKSYESLGLPLPAWLLGYESVLRPHLDLLALRWPCTPDQVKKAFRAGAMKHHPDRGGDAAAFSRVKEACDTLLMACESVSTQ